MGAIVGASDVPSSTTTSASIVVSALVVGTVIVRASDDDRIRVPAAGGNQARPSVTIPNLPAGIPQPSPAKRAHAPKDLRNAYGRSVILDDTVWLRGASATRPDQGLVAVDARTLRRKGFAGLFE